jgi:hypothetical protein
VTETPNSVASPIYDGLVTERINAGAWTPFDIGPRYDLLEHVEMSYLTIWDKKLEDDS